MGVSEAKRRGGVYRRTVGELPKRSERIAYMPTYCSARKGLFVEMTLVENAESYRASDIGNIGARKA